jgi:hypothetical protein
MPSLANNVFCFLLITFSILYPVNGQKIDFTGQIAGWMAANKSDNFAFQTGLRYQPGLSFTKPLNESFSIDGEFSLDSYVTYTTPPEDNEEFAGKIIPYRLWLRFSGNRFEVRAGLQKINFGSASMLRPLMWFDRIDPRDPLKLTTGVYGLQGKYYFKNNAGIWLWILYGNKNTKGWETVPSNPDRPEIGGRFQLPVPRGEIAISYHNRSARFPETWEPPVISDSILYPENRFGLDCKIDLGVGLWFEGTVSNQKQNEFPPYQKALTFGADYTIDFGNGLNLSAEQFVFNNSEELLGKGSRSSFTGFSAGMPFSTITRITTIVFVDWKNSGYSLFGNISFTYDNLAINLIAFWNPDYLRIYNNNSGSNMFAGTGGQIMLVYNY